MSKINEFLNELGNISIFAFKILRESIKPPYELKEFVKQSYYIGYKTLPLILITGFILGLVLTLQSRPVLQDFGAETLLPGMVAVSIIRELGPVLTALICAGKMASGIGAELGSMRVTEQIDAMEVSGINALNYVVVSRVMSTTIMVPILVFFADTVSLLGSYLAVSMRSDIELFLFLNQAFNSLSFFDIIPATIKSFFFGYSIGLVGCYKGYFCERGTEAVGLAANSAVVTSSISIFVINLLAVQITDFVVNI